MRKKSPREIYKKFRRAQLEELYADEAYGKKKAAIRQDKEEREALKENKEYLDKRESLKRTYYSKQMMEQEKRLLSLQARFTESCLVVNLDGQAGLLLESEIRNARAIYPYDYDYGNRAGNHGGEKNYFQKRELWAYVFWQNDKRRRWVRGEHLAVS